MYPPLVDVDVDVVVDGAFFVDVVVVVGPVAAEIIVVVVAGVDVVVEEEGDGGGLAVDGKEDVMVMVVDGRCLMTFAIFYLFFPPFSPQFYRRPSPQFLPAIIFSGEGSFGGRATRTLYRSSSISLTRFQRLHAFIVKK